MTTPQGQHHCDYVISSLPLGVMKRCPPRFTPTLSKRKQRSIARVGMGLLNKIVLCYNEPWWKGERATAAWFVVLPSVVAGEDEQYSLPNERMPESQEDAKWLLSHAGLFVQDYTTISGKSMLVCFTGPPTAHAQELLSDEWVVDAVHARLVESILPAAQRPHATRPCSSTVTRWQSDPYSCGSYSYLACADETTTGSSPNDMLELARPAWDGRLGFAGEHTSVDW